MPCSDGGWSEAIREEEKQKLIKRLDEVTQLLCEVCKKLEAVNPSYFLYNTNLRIWWVEHKKHDAKNQT